MTSEAKAFEPPEASDQRTSRYAYLTDREWFLGPLMLLPAVVYIVALVGFPLVLAITYAFSDVTVGDQSVDWVGFDNFEAVWDNNVFQTSLRNSLIFTVVTILLVMVLANILALVLSVDFPGKWFARFLILLPWTTPIALGAVGWLWILDSILSPIDWTLREFGLFTPTQDALAFFGLIPEPTGFERNLFYLGQENLARASVILVQVWRMLPLATVILLAGLTAIPQDINDQAAVDGAGFWRRLFEIRLPLLMPILMVALLFSIVFVITDMTVVYVLTRGGPPPGATQVLPSWAYFTGIEGGSLAQGAAIALFLFPVLLGVAVLMLRLARRSEVL